MPFFKKIEVENGIIGIWEITESAGLLISAFNFSEEEEIEFQKFKGEKRQKEYLITRLLLQHLLSEKTEIAYQKSGRPQIKNSSKHISISHSAEFVAIFISNDLAGIDVENINRNIDRVTKRFLHPDELAWIEKSDNRQISKMICWCAKEAIFKCSCESGVQFDKQIFIPRFEIGKTDFFNGRLITANGEENYNLWYFYFGNNMIVYCVEVRKEI
jgi:phosphopantetheinyl transferase (holo-ACP synthase)